MYNAASKDQRPGNNYTGQLYWAAICGSSIVYLDEISSIFGIGRNLACRLEKEESFIEKAEKQFQKKV